MTFIALAVVVAFATFVLEPQGVEAQEKVRGCYFTNWSQYRTGRAKFTTDAYLPGLCTHIFYAFAGVDPNTFASKESEANDLSTNGQYARVNALKKKDPALKTLLSYGGATFGTATFQRIASSAANRHNFIKSAVEYVKKHGFDGIDIDWEFPQAADKYGFTALMRELKAAAGKLIVTAAVSQNPAGIKAGYEGSIKDSVDFLNVMAYDYHGWDWDKKTGANAPLYDPKGLNVDNTMKTWVQLGVPKSKLVLGIASYARGWTATGGMGAAASGASRATDVIKEAGIAAYFEICDRLAKGAKRTWDATTKTPFIQYGDQWFSYDDEQSITEKANYVKNNGYRGAFFWNLDEDDFNAKCTKSNGRRFPLIGTVAKVLGGKDIKKRSALGDRRW